MELTTSERSLSAWQAAAFWQGPEMYLRKKVAKLPRFWLLQNKVYRVPPPPISELRQNSEIDCLNSDELGVYPIYSKVKK